MLWQWPANSSRLAMPGKLSGTRIIVSFCCREQGPVDRVAANLQFIQR